MSTFFISDLHLDASRQVVTERFFRFLNDDAKNADSLYILGDFFEVWVGDDILSTHDKQVMQKLAVYAQKVPTYFMHGNRDFLIGSAFLKQSNITLLSEPTLIQLHGKRILLMHGDSLCRKDIDYQRFRSFVRHPLIKWLYLRLPFFIRQKIALSIRKKSQASYLENKTIDESIYEATLEAIEEEMQKHNADILIHGHTHQPVIQEVRVQGQPKLRIVLGDWGKKSTILEYSSQEHKPILREILADF